jgi:hypothetical protein
MEQINAQRRKGDRIDVTPETILVGAGSALDSLFLLNFLVAAEERLAEDHGLEVCLIDLLAEADEATSPLRSIGALTGYLLSISEAC